MKSLDFKIKDEQERMEILEVQNYEQTLKSATMSEDNDSLLVFIEEFIKKQLGQKSKDILVFRELNESDKEDINEVLRSSGIQYKDAF